MVHLPIVDKKVSEIFNDGREYIVGINKKTVDVYVKKNNTITGKYYGDIRDYKFIFDKNKKTLAYQLIKNNHITNNDDIETIKTVFGVNDKDLEIEKEKEIKRIEESREGGK